jgi:hypothetical protein
MNDANIQIDLLPYFKKEFSSILISARGGQGFNSPPLAASCHSGESRNPEIYTGCRIRSGMTSDTPLLCGGVVHLLCY